MIPKQTFVCTLRSSIITSCVLALAINLLLIACGLVISPAKYTKSQVFAQNVGRGIAVLSLWSPLRTSLLYEYYPLTLTSSDKTNLRSIPAWSTLGTSDRVEAGQCEFGFGWPLRSVFCVIGPSHSPTVADNIYSKVALTVQLDSACQITLDSVPGVVLPNSINYVRFGISWLCIALCVMVMSAFVTRIRCRSKPGTCACGYAVLRLTVCPECGREQKA